MTAWFRRLYVVVIGLLQRKNSDELLWPALAPSTPQPKPEPEPEPEPNPVPSPKPDIVPLLAMDIIPPPEPRPTAGPQPKWAKPKGLELLQSTPRSSKPETAPRKPRAPRPQTRTDNPEQWGQYYFRDAILDQLDTYFMYLKRMKKGDRDTYELHRRLGIQIMPQSAIQAFDDWRSKGGMDELSAWWLEHRPGFGAISYGIDHASLSEEKLMLVDLSPEQAKAVDGYNSCKDIPFHRIVTITGTDDAKSEKLGDTIVKPGIIWVPKFLYFNKCTRAPATVQKVVDGDVYMMTVYWDRVGNASRKWTKRHKGGVPQEYAVCVEKSTGKVRVLRTLMHDRIKLRGRDGIFSIPNTHWGIPSEQLYWACGRLDASPEDFLRRCFIEAALMYESAAQGSMIRIEVSKGDLAAVFGVEIKRTAYFFKDRDVTVGTLTERGTRKPIFHIVRPHIRHTKTGDHPVKMQFRGLTDFEWAGYKVHISVPGRDHYHLPEFDVPSMMPGTRVPKRDLVNASQLGDRLSRQLKEGLGAWKAKGRSN